MSQTKKKFITKTFRIDADCEKILDEEAKKRGITVSALHNIILCRFIFDDRFFLDRGKITLSDSTFNHLINILTDEELDSVGELAGLTRPKLIIACMNKKLNFENIVEFVTNILGKYWGWFTTKYSTIDDKKIFILEHNFDSRFGIFLHGYFQSMLKEIINGDIISEIGEDYITIAIKNSQIIN